jgi:hypothetical protein
LLLAILEDIEVVVINVVADKNISDEVQEYDLFATSLSNKKDSRLAYSDRI